MLIFLSSIRRDWVSGKRSLKPLASNPKLLKDNYLKELFAELSLNKEINPNRMGFSEERTILHDIERIISGKTSRSERLWLGYQFNLGVEYIDIMLDSTISSFTDKHYSGSNKELKAKKHIYSLLWEVRELQGLIIKQKERVKLAVSFSSMSEAGYSPRVLLNLYARYFESVSKLQNSLQSINLNIVDGRLENPEKVNEELRSLRAEFTEVKNSMKKGLFTFSKASCLFQIFL